MALINVKQVVLPEEKRYDISKINVIASKYKYINTLALSMTF